MLLLLSPSLYVLKRQCRNAAAALANLNSGRKILGQSRRTGDPDTEAGGLFRAAALQYMYVLEYMLPVMCYCTGHVLLFHTKL